MKHHYIPQFYLKPWLGSDHKLQEFRRGYQGRIQTGRYGTLSTGFADDLYALPGVTEETRQNVERIFMGVVDTTATDAQNLLLSGIIPEGDLRASWVRFLLSLLMRTPEAIAKFKAQIGKTWRYPDPELQERYNSQKKPDWPDTFEAMMLQADPTIVDRTAILTATKMMQDENVIRLFMRAQWWVLDISQASNMSFMTSDHPLIMTNGLGRKDGHFALPISPKHLFIGFMENDFGATVRALPPEEVVATVNRLVSGQGRKYVYAVDARERALVEEVMGTLEYMDLFRMND